LNKILFSLNFRLNGIHQFSYVKAKPSVKNKTPIYFISQVTNVKASTENIGTKKPSELKILRTEFFLNPHLLINLSPIMPDRMMNSQKKKYGIAESRPFCLNEI
jgi:hypothetical protein